jgi:hypothetical protein
MSKQIFKNKIPNETLFELLNQICLKTDQYFIFNIDSFKKGVYKEIIQEFIQNCIPYYHISKRIYLERELTYVNLIVSIIHIKSNMISLFTI